MPDKISYAELGIVVACASIGAYIGGVGVNNLLATSSVSPNIAGGISLVSAYFAGKFGYSMGLKAANAFDDIVNDIRKTKRNIESEKKFNERMQQERKNREMKKEHIDESERQIFIPHRYDQFAQIYIDDNPIALYLHLPDKNGEVSNKLYNLGYIEKTEQNRVGTMITFEEKPFKELKMFDRFKEWEKQVKKAIAMKNQKPVKPVVIESNLKKGNEYVM